MSRSRNPFAILGLNPELLRELSDDQIEIMVQAAYKALQTIWHPDKPGGQAVKSQALNLALMQLDRKNNPQSYQLYKAQFLKRSTINEQVNKLQTALKQQTASKMELADAFLNYLKLTAQQEEKLTLFNLALPRTFNMKAYYSQMRLYRKQEGLSGTKAREKNLELMEYQLVIDQDYQLKKIQHGKTINLPEKKLVGFIPHETIMGKKIGSMLNILRLASPSQVLTRPRLMMDTNERADEERELVKTSYHLSLAEFGRIIHLITPLISKHGYLFAINFDEPEPYFSLEGCLINIKT